MALNVGESSAVNTVIHHLVGDRRFNGQPVSRQDAIDALVLLTAAARKTLSAGYSADSARDNLTALWPGTLHEVWMVELHGAEPEPFATEQLARHHVLTEGSWDPGSDLSWRTGETDETGRSAKILYCDGYHTLCCIWPARVRFGPLEGTEAAEARDEQARTCRVCGCTEDEPCEGGCAWVVDGSLEIDLCTACAWSIARDAIASGLYQLQPTDGDTVFEARGGLIPQPMLTEAEIDALQPLIEEVEAAHGDVGKLEEIAEREQAKAASAANEIACGVPSRERIEEIRRIAWNYNGVLVRKRPNSAIAHRRELLRAYDALTAEIDAPQKLAAQHRYVLPSGISAGAIDSANIGLDEAASRRASAFLAAWDKCHTARDQVLAQVKPGSPEMLTSDDLRTVLDGRARLACEVEQLQVELGYALAPDEDDDPEPLTLRDVDPDAVYASEGDDFDDERAEAHQDSQDGDR